MTRKLSYAIKKRLKHMGLNEKLWSCKFMFKIYGVYHFKVIYDGNTKHGEYTVWSCYFSGDYFVFDTYQSQQPD